MNNDSKIPKWYQGLNYKVCLIGDGGVGKTAIIENFKGHKFHTKYVLTIGTDISTHEICLDGQKLTLQIWDLAGQSRFNVVRTLYYRGSHAAIMVFDRTRPESLKNLIMWREELFTNTGREVPFIIVGNKSDLPNKVDSNSIKEFINSSQKLFINIEYVISYIETSAKTGKNIKKIFEITADIIKKYIENYSKQA